MTVREVTPAAGSKSILAGAQFADAYRITTSDPALNARGAAEIMLGRQPAWVTSLMALRNRIVAPFGLKTPAPKRTAGGNIIGIFPVLDETPERVIAGFNDKHLDFCVIIDVVHADAGTIVTATTLVRTHNLLGRSYLVIITPFHRMVVKSMLEQLAAPAR